MAITERKVTSLAEFFSAVKEYSENRSVLWFRGHASDEYKLAPSIYRAPYTAEKEKEFMDWFKAKGIKFFPDKTGYFEWLFIMQHYGTPTRLLDWSESAVVALAFATQYRNESHRNKDAIIWCLDPFKVNELANYGGQSIINICEDQEVARIYQGKSRSVLRPIAILGSYNSERIIAQKGVFTLFPMKESFYLEEEVDADSYLMKIVVPSDYVSSISQELYFIGVNELSLFPEPESISKEIKRFDKIREE